jgi:hypothetical protein
VKLLINVGKSSRSIIRINIFYVIAARYHLCTVSKTVTLAGMNVGYDKFRDSGSSARPRGHRTKPQKIRIRLALARLMIVVVLLFGKRPPSVTAADIASWPLPCWIGEPTPGAGDAREGEASNADLAGHGPGAETWPGSGGALEERLVKPRGALEARRHRVRRRLRDLARRVRRRLRNPRRPGPRSPQRAPRRTRRRPGRRSAEPD